MVSSTLSRHYFIRVESSVIRLSLGLNDAPILTDPKAEGMVATYPVNEWLMPGANELTAFVSWPASRDYVPGTAHLNAILFLSEPGLEVVEPLTILARLNYPLPAVPEFYPIPLRVSFTMDQPIGTRVWNQAEEINDLNDTDKAKILELVESFRGALARRDHDTAFQIIRYKYEEQAIAEGFSVDRLREVVVSQYEEMSQEQNLTSISLTLDDATFEVVCNKKLIHVGCSNSRAAVIFENEEDRYSIEIYVAKLNSRWTIVR